MAVDPTKLDWARSDGAGVGARALVWLALALGHLLFAWSPLWDWGAGPWLPLAVASDSLGVLTVALWGPPRAARSPLRAFEVALGIAVVVGGVAVIAAPAWLGGRAVETRGFVAVAALAWGLLSAVVAVPLAVVIHRWRADPGLRHTLDLVAALIAAAALFAFARPRGLADALYACLEDPAQLSLRIRCEAIPTGRLLARFGDALLSSALAMAVGLWAWERRLRQWLDDARGGRVPGHKVVEAGARVTEGLPRWTLDDGPCSMVVVRERPEEGYRDDANERPVALLAASEAPSWREYALPAVALLCVLGLWLRLRG